jgi:hypothetical protein
VHFNGTYDYGPKKQMNAMLSKNQENSRNRENGPETHDNKDLKHYLKSNYQATLNRHRKGSVRDSEMNNVTNGQFMSSANTGLRSMNSSTNNGDSPTQTIPKSTVNSGVPAQTQLKLNATKPIPDTITANTTFGTFVSTPTPVTCELYTSTRPLTTNQNERCSTVDIASVIPGPPPVTLNSQNLPLHEIQDTRILQYIHQLESYVRYQTQQTAQLAAQFNTQLPQTSFTAFPYPLPYVPQGSVDGLNWLGTANTAGASQPGLQRVVPTSVPTINDNFNASIFNTITPQPLQPQVHPSPIKNLANEGVVGQANSAQRTPQPQLVVFAPVLSQNSVPLKATVSAPVISDTGNMDGSEKSDEGVQATVTTVNQLDRTLSQSRVTTPRNNVVGSKSKRGPRARLYRNVEDGDIILRQRNYSYPIPDRPPYCVWLGNMPSTAGDKDLVEYLGKMGVVMKDIRWGRRQGAHTCCYVDFYGVEDMKVVLETVDAPNAPRFMGRLLQIDINEGIRVDRESAVTAVTTRPLKNKSRRPTHGSSNNEIYVTASRNHAKFNQSSNNLISMEEVSSLGGNPNASQSASCLLTHVTPRRKE